MELVGWLVGQLVKKLSFFLSVPQQPNSGVGRPIVEVSRSHTDTHSVGLL